MDKSLIINNIIKYYRYKSDADFARRLGVKPQVLSNWKARNTFDAELIYTKCLDINPHWLLTGEGEMLKGPQGIKNPDEKDQHIIDLQKKYIQKLEEEIKALKKEQNPQTSYRNVVEPGN